MRGGEEIESHPHPYLALVRSSALSDKFRAGPLPIARARTHNRSLFPNPKFRIDAVVTVAAAAAGREEEGREPRASEEETQYSKGASRPRCHSFVPSPIFPDPYTRRHRHHKYPALRGGLFISPALDPLYLPRREPGGRTADQFCPETDLDDGGGGGDCRRLVTSLRNPASAFEGNVEAGEGGFAEFEPNLR